MPKVQNAIQALAREFADRIAQGDMADEDLASFERRARKALGADPQNIEALGLLIEVLYHQEQYQDALVALKRWDGLTDEEHPLALDVAEDAADEADIITAREEIASGEVYSWEEVRKELGL